MRKGCMLVCMWFKPLRTPTLTLPFIRPSPAKNLCFTLLLEDGQTVVIFVPCVSVFRRSPPCMFSKLAVHRCLDVLTQPLSLQVWGLLALDPFTVPAS